MKKLNWQPMWGRFETNAGLVRFIGEEVVQPTGPAPGYGLTISDHWFSGGAIEAAIEFASEENTAAEIVLYYDPETNFTLTAGIGAPGLFNVRYFSQKAWVVHATSGDRRNLAAGRKYRVRATLRGSSVTLTVDGVLALSATLPFTLPQSQIGLWCWGLQDVRVSQFNVQNTPGEAFIVMPFHGGFDDLHGEVICKVCKSLDLKPVRADEITGPGIVVADISQKISDAQVVIAEVTDSNCNVYYEIGYAHALNKPTVLLALQGTKTLFDVAPFRVLFYQNTIGGKPKLEASLKKHLETVLREWNGA